jgi:copper homeostasis protein
VRLGFGRVLTSGGAETAVAGIGRLRETFGLAQGRISVMPGAGLTADSVAGLRGLPLREVHASCSVAGRAAPFGLGAPRRTEAARVKALKAALVDLGGTSG